jgi:hypothetical protein
MALTYIGLKSKKWQKYYWINIVEFCRSFLKEYQELIAVYYFAAVPKDQDKKDRQDLFFSANKLNPKFKLANGYIIRRPTSWK